MGLAFSVLLYDGRYEFQRFFVVTEGLSLFAVLGCFFRIIVVEDGLYRLLKGVAFSLRAGLVNAFAGSDRYFMGVAYVDARFRRIAHGNIDEDVHFFMVRGSVCGLVFGCFN